MTNKGVVTEVNGDTLTVAFERHEACGDCHACMHGSESCAKHTVKLKGKANVGDIIEVEMDSSHVMEASALAYMLPLAGFIIGLAGGWLVSKGMNSRSGELMMALFAVLGTAVAYVIMRVLDTKLSKGRWEKKIVSVTPAKESFSAKKKD